MRRLSLTLLFPLLLIAQQGAFVHGLSHLAAGPATSAGSPAGASKTQDDRHAPGDQYCDKCFTFAQVGAAADLSPALAAEFFAAFDAIGFRLPVEPFAFLGIPRSRGPPSFL